MEVPLKGKYSLTPPIGRYSNIDGVRVFLFL